VGSTGAVLVGGTGAASAGLSTGAAIVQQRAPATSSTLPMTSMVLTLLACTLEIVTFNL